LALGVSSYNEDELRSLGYERTGILPITLDESRYQWPNNERIVHDLGRESGADAGPILLFVGRISPNKKQEDLVKLLYYYRRIEPAARLVLVGDKWLPAYARWIVELAESLELANALLMTGRVSQQDLVTYYRNCDLYLSMSEHEGFGKPLIESMYLGLPIMAYRSTAVPGTLGNAGILFRRKDFEALAEVVDIIIGDRSFQNRITIGQMERVQHFLEPRIKEKLHYYLDELDLHS
jgi:glycosyltransferase involved in cell wall biosynthesis